MSRAEQSMPSSAAPVDTGPPPDVGERRRAERRGTRPSLPPRAIGSGRGRFHMVRFFSLSSLASVLVVAVLMTALYRQVALGAIIDFGERTNLMVAQTALLTIKPRLIAYLDNLEGLSVAGVVARPLDADVEATIHDLMDHTNVVRVLVHTRDGVVAFSTKHDQIGTLEDDNQSFHSAIAGALASRLIYRDIFNTFSPVTDEDNLIQTYIPIRRNNNEPAHGVFEIYTDVTQSVDQVERAEVVVLAGSILALMLLYAVLMLIVRRGATIIENQQETIRERTQTLELLSARMLTAQEAEKQRIANRLHEEVGQNIAAIKRLTARTFKSDGAPSPRRQKLEELTDETLRDVMGLAVALRPPSLDEFGLLQTLDALCGEYATIYPHLTLEPRFGINEAQVPLPLRVIIYRIAQESLAAIGQASGTHHVQIGLGADREVIRLTLAVQAPAEGTPAAKTQAEPLPLAAARERTVLSGGSFSVSSDTPGATVYQSTWRVAPPL